MHAGMPFTVGIGSPGCLSDTATPMGACCSCLCGCIGTTIGETCRFFNALPIWAALGYIMSCVAGFCLIHGVMGLMAPFNDMTELAGEGHKASISTVVDTEVAAVVGTLLFFNALVTERVFAFKLSLRYPQTCGAPFYGLDVKKCCCCGWLLTAFFKFYPFALLIIAWTTVTVAIIFAALFTAIAVVIVAVCFMTGAAMDYFAAHDENMQAGVDTMLGMVFNNSLVKDMTGLNQPDVQMPNLTAISVAITDDPDKVMVGAAFLVAGTMILSFSQVTLPSSNPTPTPHPNPDPGP